MIIPVSKDVEKAADNFKNGNFGLWFNKMIPVNENDDFKACDENDNKDKRVFYYLSRYQKMKSSSTLKTLLGKKHNNQKEFCEMWHQSGADVIEIKAVCRSPLIMGIGQTHPNEVGMTFDHTLGIPYIPATSIKGLVRLSHLLNLVDDPEQSKVLIEGDFLDDTDPASLIPRLFGGDEQKNETVRKRRGNIIFLDAYPDAIPDLKEDIMNPHYGDYYMDDSASQPPADYLEPKPVKFLTVARQTAFVFRAVIAGKNETWLHALKSAFQVALAEEGFGAKTAVGYGRFQMENADPAKGSMGVSVSKAKMRDKSSPEREIWKNVYLTYAPGNQEITATSEKKKAMCKDKTVIPETMSNKFFRQRRVTVSEVEVEPIGNAFRIVSIKQ